MTQSRTLMFLLIVAGTVIGLAGTDLVLPAIPFLPDYIDGTLQQSQLVLAAFTGGTAIGLLCFGEFGARYDQKKMLVMALVAYGVFSGVAVICTNMTELIICRAFQGFVAAAPAVFAPGMIRALFDERQALRALGLMGSIESVVPALAPVLGAWLLTFLDWRASFILTAGLAILLACAWMISPSISQPVISQRSGSGYLRLMRSAVFLRYAVSQAGSLGGLLVFVFGAPTVMTVAMGGELSDFITMQIIGITLFIITTNLVHHIVDRLGNEPTIMLGSSLCAAGCIAILVYGLLAEPVAQVIWFLFAFVNVGIGLRGPPGFYQAILAAEDDDARGAALVMLMVFVAVAGGTAMVAPVIEIGLVPLAAMASFAASSSVIILLALPVLDSFDSGASKE